MFVPCKQQHNRPPKHFFIHKSNQANNITPTTVFKTKEQIIEQGSILKVKSNTKAYIEPDTNNESFAADPVVQYMSKDQLNKSIDETKKKMQKAAKDLDFIEAARLRDEMYALQEITKKKFGE